MSNEQQLRRGLSTANTANLIAVAAAAGSFETIKTLASQNRQLLWTMSPAFGYPLNAAVYADQLVVVKALAHQAVVETNHTVEVPSVSQIPFRYAICTAIDCQCHELAKHLLEKYIEAFGPVTEACLEDWLDKAMTAGDEELASLLMYTDTQAGTATFYTAFDKNILTKSPQMIRIYFEEGRLSLNHIFRSSYPLLTGINKYMSAPAIKELLEMGANPDEPTYLGGLDRPLRAAMRYGLDKVLLQLLRAGANPHLVPLSVWQPHLDRTSAQLTPNPRLLNTRFKKSERQRSKMALEADKTIKLAFERCEKPAPLIGELFEGF